MKLTRYIIFFALLLNTHLYLFSTVENSIISTIELHECPENLAIQKLTKSQHEEICAALARKDEKIRLLTYNMLFNLYDHNLEEENRWPNRLPRLVELIEETKPDVIDTQELYPDQAAALSELIAETYDFFPGHKDPDGESYGIFYRKERFELVKASMKYPLSMVQLKDLKTEKIVAVFNTHMPLSNIEKREANARLIAARLESYSQQMPVIFTGDLNTFPARFDLPDLPFYDGDYIHRILASGSMKNAKEVSLLGHFGPISTFTNDETGHTPFKGTGTPGIILDHIYVSKGLTVLAHGVQAATVNGHYPSDHMPVLIDFFID